MPPETNTPNDDSDATKEQKELPQIQASSEIVQHQFGTLPEFLNLIEKYKNSQWIFRGQSDASLPLLPKAGRPEFFHPSQGGDLIRFEEWRKQAIAFVPNLPESDFECLAFAQHYGLATRLLDWTTNPLVALYFAAEADFDKTGGVFCHLLQSAIVDKSTTLRHQPEVMRYDPRPFDRRIQSQQAVFTYHSRPNVSLNPKPINLPPPFNNMAPDGFNLVQLKVIPVIKSTLLTDLNGIGINRKSLFPDLEGLSHYLNWKTLKSVKTAQVFRRALKKHQEAEGQDKD